MRKLLGLVLLATLVITGCSNQSSVSPSAKKTLLADTNMDSKPFTFKSSGDKTTDGFSLKKGFVIVDAQHTGESNFAVKLIKGEKTEDLLVNTIGKYKGQTLALTTSDDYTLEVKADGPWTITLTQSAPPVRSSSALKGKGDTVMTVSIKDTEANFTFSHTGKENFAVLVGGKYLLVNEIGTYSGSKTYSMDDAGTYIISVKADGYWSIGIKQ